MLTARQQPSWLLPWAENLGKMTKDYTLGQKGNQDGQKGKKKVINFNCEGRSLVASDQALWSEATQKAPAG